MTMENGKNMGVNFFRTKAFFLGHPNVDDDGWKEFSVAKLTVEFSGDLCCQNVVCCCVN